MTQKHKIAVPVEGGCLSAHFGHAAQFDVYDLDENGRIVKKETLAPPPHAPGVIPRWLAGIKTTAIIAGGMGQMALDMFAEAGITVCNGAGGTASDVLVKQFVDGKLTNGVKPCEHHGDHNCDH